MAEAHQLDVRVLVLDLLDELADLFHAAFALDVVQHVQCRFVGAAVGRAPQARHAGCNGREGVGARRAAQAHGRGRGVLLVVCVQDEDAVERALEHRVHLVLFARRGEHHVQEVACIAQFVLRVHVRLADGVLVGHGHERGHLRDQTDRGDLAVLGIVDVRAVVIEGRQGAHEAGHDGHRVGITAEAAQEELHLLVDHRVVGHELGEAGLLACVRQFTVQQQVAGLHEVAVGRELLDGVAAVQQLALVTVDVGDGRLAGGGRHEARVVREHAGLCIQLADVDHVGPDGALVDRQFDVVAAIAERQRGLGIGCFHFGLLSEEDSGRRRDCGTLRAIGTHQMQQCDHLGAGPFGLGLLSAQQKVQEVVVRQVHQCLHRSRLTVGHVGFVPLEEAGDEQVVLEQAAPATPFQLAQRTFAERLLEFVGGLHGGVLKEGQMARRTISSLILPMALVGFRLFGHTSTQFMIVWQRNRRYGSFRLSRRSPVAWSRLSAMKR
ncbi:hypothetical protein D9M68_610420 [compost metagenome]